MISWLKNLLGGPPRHCASPHTRRWPRLRPRLEALEERIVPSITPTELAISGVGATNNLAPATASSRNGMHVVVWAEQAAGFVNTPPPTAVIADIYSAGGGLSKVVTIPGTSTKGTLQSLSPSVAMDDKGDFVVAWCANDNIVAARYTANGQLRGGLITVAGSSLKEFDPGVAMDAAGNFVVGYTRWTTSTNQDVYAARYEDNGTSLGSFAVASSSLNERNGRVAMTADGRISIVYELAADVYLKRYAANGALLIQMPIANGTDPQNLPSVAVDNAGNTVVAWQERFQGVQSIFARTVNAAGIKNRIVNVGPGTAQAGAFNASVAMNPVTGAFVVTYQTHTAGAAKDPVQVAEVASNSSVKASYSLGLQNTLAAPRVSINAAGAYSVVYTANGFYDFDTLGPNGNVVPITFPAPAIRGRTGKWL
jgi:hypothetical protein